jgi:uncharacterized protein with GYD domain
MPIKMLSLSFTRGSYQIVKAFSSSDEIIEYKLQVKIRKRSTDEDELMTKRTAFPSTSSENSTLLEQSRKPSLKKIKGE